MFSFAKFSAVILKKIDNHKEINKNKFKMWQQVYSDVVKALWSDY